MREGWVEKKLGNLCVVLDSQRKPVAKINRKKGIFPYYGANGLLDYVDDYIFEGKYVLLGEDGANWDSNASSSYIVDGKIWVNNHAHVIKVNNLLNDEYLVYYLNYKDLNKYISGAIIKKLTQSSLKEINIEYPDLSFQEKIVSELDKISEMISKYDEQLKELDKLSQSIFYEMFGDPVENEKGWEVKKLEYICDVRDGTHDSPKYVRKSEYILITSKNIVNGKIDFENVNFITEEDYVKINKRSKVDDGDIIMPMIGTIGNPIIVQTNNIYKFCIKNVALIKFIKEATIKNLFLLNLLKTTAYAEYLISLNKGGTQKFVSLGIIRNLPIILPPLALQQSFARKIEAIEAMKSKVREAKKEAETLLAARMQYWFE